jgi:hypothetical protein
MTISSDTLDGVMQYGASPDTQHFVLGGAGLKQVLAGSGDGGPSGAWILAIGATDAAGHPVSTLLPRACIKTATNWNFGSPALPDCLTSQGLREAISYEPASRYWPLQWTETGIYLVLSAGLAGYCFRRLRRLS